jgi:hypothetical protein
MAVQRGDSSAGGKVDATALLTAVWKDCKWVDLLVVCLGGCLAVSKASMKADYSAADWDE